MVKTIRLHCDNQAVVSVINSGKTKDAILAGLGRNGTVWNLPNMTSDLKLYT